MIPRRCFRKWRRSRSGTPRSSGIDGGAETTRRAPKATARSHGMTAARSRYIDWTAPFTLAMVLLLAALVIQPMFRLLVTSLSDEVHALTFAHYRQLFADPAFVKPL